MAFAARVAPTAQAGWEPTTRLLPDPADTELLATVELAGPVRPETDLALLYPAIPPSAHQPPAVQRRGDTPSDTGRPVGAARWEGARLVFPAAAHVEEVLDLVGDAEGRDSLDPAMFEDVVRWTRIGSDAAASSDGIPDYAFGPRKRGGKAPVCDFAGRRPVADRDAARTG
ncbi:hypothetical protein [Streptomyces sp. 7N604]|uniref:hypothetical protein n=1 Tax=Streptomyces sp. 7N604 TaxID=3457415 RepID=UPI003FCF06C2